MSMTIKEVDVYSVAPLLVVSLPKLYIHLSLLNKPSTGLQIMKLSIIQLPPS
jgi:hypothetical protein